MSIKEVFTNDMYIRNKEIGIESVSGIGSCLDQTKTIIERIPSLLKKYNIGSILDAPCGDFNWMKVIELGDIQYIGWDIVVDVIRHNKHKTPHMTFSVGNIIEDSLPGVDLMICRDCLVHFSYKNISLTIENIIKSKVKYLLTTSFIDRTHNDDIETGKWRPLNLMAPPFNFPEPIMVINENCTEGDMGYTDKSLGLWLISDLSDGL